MPKWPRSSELRVSPSLMAQQVDSLVRRIEHAWCLPGSGVLDVTVKQMGALLFALFPEQFDGDPTEAYAEAAAIRAEQGGVRPMSNGYVPPKLKSKVPRPGAGRKHGQ